MSVRAVAVSVALLLAAGTPLVAQEKNHLYDKFQASASAATVFLGTTMRIDPESGEGSEVSLEDDLGLSKAGVRPRLGFRWRPWRKQEFEAFYILISRQGDRTLARDITIDSITYSAGAGLSSDIRSNQLGVNWRWALHASEKSQIGTSLGLGATFFKFDLTGSAGVTSSGETFSDSLRYQKSLPGPLFALGGYGRWRLQERWYVEADLRGLYVPIENIKIGIVDGGGAVRYFPLDWLGTELGYSLTWQKVTIDRKDNPALDLNVKSGSIKYTSQNLRLGVVATF